MNLEEFEARALPHLDATYRLAMVLTEDAFDASELVYTTYRRAMTAADRIGSEDPRFKLSLLRILRSIYSARSRECKHDSMERVGRVSGQAAPQQPHHDDPLGDAIRGLPARYRSVLLLWSVEGLTYAQIAEVEDVPKEIAQRWLNEARQILVDVADETCPPLAGRSNGFGRAVAGTSRGAIQ